VEKSGIKDIQDDDKPQTKVSESPAGPSSGKQQRIHQPKTLAEASTPGDATNAPPYYTVAASPEKQNNWPQEPQE
jgi:hypothetical protein